VTAARGLIGIDFSGSVDQWKPRCKNPNVWLAFATMDGAGLRIDALKPVQALDGEGPPFERLLRLLANTDAVAGIDASFSVPVAYAASATETWAKVAALAHGERPFVSGRQFVRALAPDTLPNGVKVYRASEAYWRTQRLNVRSNLWCGPRGGAAFTAACMTLLHRHSGPVWPLRPGGAGALLVEAYPAAQLRTWGLNPQGYNGPTPKAAKARETLVQALVREHDLRADEAILETCRQSADALDAVICAYGARALARGRHPRRLPAAARVEGWTLVEEPIAPLPQPAEPTEAAGLVEPMTEVLVRRLFDRAFEASDAG
jgi:hypothetical protein